MFRGKNSTVASIVAEDKCMIHNQINPQLQPPEIPTPQKIMVSGMFITKLNQGWEMHLDCLTTFHRRNS